MNYSVDYGRINKIDKIQMYLTIPYLIIYILYLKIASFRYITFGLMMMFIIGFLLKFKKSIKIKYLYFVFFLILLFIMALINNDIISAIKNIIMIILNFAPIYIFDFFFDNNEGKKELWYSKKFLVFTIPVIVYDVFATLFFVFKNPYTARYLASWDPALQNGGGLPIAIGGGYALVYAIILIPPTLFFLVKTKKEKDKTMLIYIVISIFILYFIVQAGFTTAFILSIIGIALCMFKDKSILDKVIVLTLVLLIALFFLNKSSLQILIDFITNILPNNSIISVRLNEIIPVIFDGNRISSFGIRINELERSMDAFLSNPFLGIGYKVGYNYILEAKYLGLHTEWIDIMGRYGIILGLPYITFIYLSFKQLVTKYRKNEYSKLIKILIFIILLLGFLNPFITTSAFIFLFVIIPSLINVNIKKESGGNLK